ncbi:MAG: 1-deoxy-D-xylulose-5-phosphate reductoisomerase [Actinomycetota bacterium]|nr:1-deoxy-D-xylulose-5-phosphate reductoisomerase [Actinomycetota bacterium]
MGATGVTSLAVIGSTGSIGTQTLEVVRAAAPRYEVTALAASTSVELLAAQAKELRPAVVAIADPSRAAELRDAVPAGTEVRAGPESLASLCELADVVLNAVVGFAGMGVTVAALEAGCRLALANKESLIAAGPVVRRVRREPGAGELVPVDSEHSALHQCLRSGRHDEVARLVLTASGGPFRGRGRAELADVTVDQALAHPTWSMGPKITIDSSTLVNKGLEVIEAHELFDVGYDDIDVVVHPQSIVHSMVEYRDGSTIAQLSMPDMRLPIAYALAHPERSTEPFGRIDWANVGRLDFEPPDVEAFGCLGLAYEAGRRGETAPAWFNAANEVAVAAFLAGEIGWLTIADVLEATLSRHDGTRADSIEVVVEADRRAREIATEETRRRRGRH